MLTEIETVQVTVLDQASSGEILNQLKMEFQSATVTLRDLISGRVRQETKRLFESSNRSIYSLIGQTDLETSRIKPLDMSLVQDEKVKYALEMFQKNSFLVLVDDLQVTSLDQEIRLTNDTAISFLKLVPLIGG